MLAAWGVYSEMDVSVLNHHPQESRSVSLQMCYSDESKDLKKLQLASSVIYRDRKLEWVYKSEFILKKGIRVKKTLSMYIHVHN